MALIIMIFHDPINIVKFNNFPIYGNKLNKEEDFTFHSSTE